MMDKKKKIWYRIAFLMLAGVLGILFLSEKEKYDLGLIQNRKDNKSFDAMLSSEKEYGYIFADSSQFTRDIPYANEDIFGILKAFYAKIDFKGEFEKGDIELYSEYKRVFLDFLMAKGSFWDSKTGEEMDLKDVYELNLYVDDTDDIQDCPYEYFFFDVDGDGTPELGLYNNKGRTEKYFFKYIPEKKQIVLWHTMLGSWEIWLGSRKMACPWGGEQYLWFYQYDMDGKVECETNCFVVYLNELESMYMVMVPKYAEEDKKIQIPDGMKQQGAYSQADEQWFFRVTEEQYNEIIASYMEACEFGEEEIKKVTYTYEELFGSLTPSQ